MVTKTLQTKLTFSSASPKENKLPSEDGIVNALDLKLVPWIAGNLSLSLHSSKHAPKNY